MRPDYKLLTMLRLSLLPMEALAAPQPYRRASASAGALTPLRLAAALTFLALALRLINLDGRPLWLDEAFSAWFSDHSWHYLWTVLPTYEAHPPFYYSLLKLWRSLFGDGATALRSLSVLFSTLTVPVVMAAALEQERAGPDRPSHACASGLPVSCGACSPMLMFIGQEARPYPLADPRLCRRHPHGATAHSAIQGGRRRPLVRSGSCWASLPS